MIAGSMIGGPILLTGAGGDIGIALTRVLREALPHAAIIGADCDRHAVGAEFVDRFCALPRANDPRYLSALEELVEREGVQVLIPLAEAELGLLATEGLLGERFGKAALITANPQAVQTGLDKYTTAKLLSAAGIGTPETGIVGDEVPGNFDVIIKPRSGQGSKGLRQVARADFDALVPARRGDLWQRWLKDDGAEFTCGIARFQGMPTRSLSFRRTLQGGLTGKGEVAHDPCLTRVCEQVAEALDLNGAINIQLRMDAGEPRVFEINPRFSSTVGFRHRLGFHDAIWAIQDRLGIAIGGYDQPAEGTRIERVATEVIRQPAPG